MHKCDVQLFIGDNEVEFSNDPKILLNFKQDEINNPTIVRNSFTKSIQIAGTNKNNEIFGHIWKLDRSQYYGSFNPMKKAPFKLFVNGELFQRGYVKLDTVETSNNQITYSITLYGGLGDFFYNLSYDEDSDSDNKKTLADITYSIEGDRIEPEMDFVINKETIANAWGFGTEWSDRWNVINFVPAYNGIPSDFDASKVMINNYQQNPYIFLSGKTEDGKNYRPVLNGHLNDEGYSLGEMQEDLTEWETFDLRSYLQRPCLSMYRLIEACRVPENNGGYKVDLDSHFFYFDNPYYRDAWVTLPMLRDLTKENTASIEQITGATLTRSGQTGYEVGYETTSVSSLNNVHMKIGISFTPNTATSAVTLYNTRNYKTKSTITLQGNKFVKKYNYNSGVVVQLQAYDIQNKLVATSKAYLLSSEKNFPNSNRPLYAGIDVPSCEWIQGRWRKNGNKYDYIDENGNIIGLDFSFTAQTQIATLMLRAYQPEGYDIKYVFFGREPFTKDAGSTSTSNPIALYSSKDYSDTGNKRKGEVMAMDRVYGYVSFNINEFDAVATAYDSFFSNTKISKHQLLSLDKTPAQYLIDYCKLFGLYFYYDSSEEAEDTDRYPKGVIHIMDRDTFYTDEVVSLSDKIDYSRKMTITPSTADAKWYLFDLEHIDSEANSDYLANYDFNYGRQLVNTSYNFDHNTVNLLDGNVFKAGEMVLEKDKYYKQPVENIPPYVFNGLTYKLFTADGDEYSEIDIEQEVSTTNYWHNLNSYDLDYYDRFPKLQCHSTDNNAVDGDGVLVFRWGDIYAMGAHSYYNYWITDDNADMEIVNEGTPCWLLTNSEYDANGEKIAIKTQQLPYYTRDIVQNGDSQLGNIVHSWNFGHPMVTFIPQTFTTDGDCIYDKWWKDYMSDMYNVDSRRLTCYVKMDTDGKPWTYWLRRFYWFQNSLWRLNAITDLNMSSFEPTKCEFIKVNDRDNYKLDKIDSIGEFEIILDQNVIGYQGGTITGRVLEQSNAAWYVSDSIKTTDGDGTIRYYDSYDIMTPISGRGLSTEIAINVPPYSGSTPLTWEIGIEDGFDMWHFATFTQQTNGQGYINIVPPSQTIRYNASGTTYTVSTTNIVGNLSVEDNAEWVTAILSGDTLSATVATNNSEVIRQALITLNGTDRNGNTVSKSAVLTQNGNGIYTNVNQLTFDYVYDGSEEGDITVISDTEWIITDTDIE